MGEYRGGCECGAVRYCLSEDPIFVNCCHCRQCQKITGSAFAINGMVEGDRLHIDQGTEQFIEQDGEARCRGCKTLLWSVHQMFGDNIKFVRLGTLDESERIEPDAHFFVRSKHSWVTIPDHVRRFETLPAESDRPLMSAAAMIRLGAAQGR